MIVTLAISLAAATLLAFFVFPRVLRWCGKLAGRQIRSKTSSRRSLLLDRADKDEAEQAKHPSQAQLDREWERIDTDTTVNTPDRDWAGVIGFFHPFWYLLPLVAN